MGRIRKIPKHKEERDRSGKFKKIKETMEERKRRDFYICGGSHTHVFLIGGTPSGYRPHGTLPQENPLGWEPPLQHI